MFFLLIYYFWASCLLYNLSVKLPY